MLALMVNHALFAKTICTLTLVVGAGCAGTGVSPEASPLVLADTSAPAPDRPWTEPMSIPAASPVIDQEDEFFLPLFADKAREMGYKLPLPLGAGVSFMYINRPTAITGVQAGVNNGGLNEVNFLSFDATATVTTAITRVDAWILPMVNVYLLGGYIWNESTVNMSVDLPGAPNTPLTSEGNLEGPVYGAGITAAGGYKELFASLDFNYTHSDFGKISAFQAALTTLRMGWNTVIDGADVRLWTGLSYWDTKRTISGSIQTGGAPIQSIQFAVDQEPVDPVTALLGTSITLSDNFWLMLELQGWQDTRALLGGVTFRF
jgi:hypothetical protein